MGWATVDEIVGRRTVEPLDRVLKRLQDHRAELDEACSDDHQAITRATIEQAARARSDAWMRHLEGLQRVARTSGSDGV